MVTAIVILLVVIAVVSIIGGVSMMFNNDGCFFSWWMGYHAFTAGIDIIAHIIPAVLEALADSTK